MSNKPTLAELEDWAESVRLTIEELDRDVVTKEGRVLDLNEWLHELQLGTYTSDRGAHHDEVDVLHRQYKEWVRIVSANRQAYWNRPRARNPEQHLRSAEAGMEWVTAALNEAEGHLTVLVTYRKNYSDTGRIRRHIVAAGDAVNGAKQAVNQMKKHRQVADNQLKRERERRAN